MKTTLYEWSLRRPTKQWYDWLPRVPHDDSAQDAFFILSPNFVSLFLICLYFVLLPRQRDDRLPRVPHDDGAQDEGHGLWGGDQRGVPCLRQGWERVHLRRRAEARHDQPRRKGNAALSLHTFLLRRLSYYTSFLTMHTYLLCMPSYLYASFLTR